MAIEQSSSDYAARKIRLSDLSWLILGAVRGSFELAKARRILSHIGPKEIAAGNERFGKHDSASTQVSRSDQLRSNRILWLIPRLAKRLPWRGDCLVQAIAAQNWLGSLGQPTRIVIGVQKDVNIGFGSHAWLESRSEHGSKVMLGNDGKEYTPIIQADPAKH